MFTDFFFFFCIIINCSNSLESILHFLFYKKVRLLKSPNAAEQSCSSYTSVKSQFKSNSNRTKRLLWRGLQLHRKWLRWKNPICDHREPSSGSWMKGANQKAEQQKASMFQQKWEQLIYGLTKTKHTKSISSFVFLFASKSPAYLSESVWKLKYKIKIYVTVQYFYYNISQILHLYQHS